MVCRAFQEDADSRAHAIWSNEGTEEKLQAISSALVEAGKTILGIESRCQPEWFRDSMNLQSAIEQKNKLYSRWFATKNIAYLQKFQRARSETRQAIRVAKNKWFQEKAE